MVYFAKKSNNILQVLLRTISFQMEHIEIELHIFNDMKGPVSVY